MLKKLSNIIQKKLTESKNNIGYNARLEKKGINYETRRD